MAGLESLTGDDPSGGESPTQGDNRIRELTQKTKESVSKEHTLSGIHAIMSGTSTVRPAAGNEGRFYILTNSGVEKELQYDNGSTWESITKNQTVIDQITVLTNHKNSYPIDHADGSIERDHLGTGILAKKHFGIANNNNSVKELVDGSETTLHTHPESVGNTASGIPTFLSSVSEIASGTSSSGTHVKPATTYTFSGSQVPDGSVAVILEAYGNTSVKNINTDVVYNPKIRIRKNSSSPWMLLIGGRVGYVGTWDYGIYSVGWRGQGIFPVATDKKIQYEVEGFNDGWELRIAGYI